MRDIERASGRGVDRVTATAAAARHGAGRSRVRRAALDGVIDGERGCHCGRALNGAQ
jgi:hypothetical protein